MAAWPRSSAVKASDVGLVRNIQTRFGVDGFHKSREWAVKAEYFILFSNSRNEWVPFSCDRYVNGHWMAFINVGNDWNEDVNEIDWKISPNID